MLYKHSVRFAIPKNKSQKHNEESISIQDLYKDSLVRAQLCRTLMRWKNDAAFYNSHEWRFIYNLQTNNCMIFTNIMNNFIQEGSFQKGPKWVSHTILLKISIYLILISLADKSFEYILHIYNSISLQLMTKQTSTYYILL